MYNLKSLKNVSKIALLIVLTIMLSVLFVGCDNKKGADVSNENKITLTNEQCKVAIQAAATATETATKQEMNSNVLSTKMLLSQSNENDFLFIEDESKYVDYKLIPWSFRWTEVPQMILKFSLDTSIYILDDVNYNLSDVVSGFFHGVNYNESIYEVKVCVNQSKEGFIIGQCFMTLRDATNDVKMLIKYEINYDFKLNKLNYYDANYFIKEPIVNSDVKETASIIKYNNNKLMLSKVLDVEKAPEDFFGSGYEGIRDFIIVSGDRFTFLKDSCNSIKNLVAVKEDIDFSSSAKKYMNSIT